MITGTKIFRTQGAKKQKLLIDILAKRLYHTKSFLAGGAAKGMER
jgi:hypothetical protein